MTTNDAEPVPLPPNGPSLNVRRVLTTVEVAVWTVVVILAAVMTVVGQMLIFEIVPEFCGTPPNCASGTFTVPRSEIKKLRAPADTRPSGIPDPSSMLEITRLVCMPYTVRGMSFAEFSVVRAGTEPLQTSDGRLVERDATTWTISSALVVVEKGCHERDRFWQMPNWLPEGIYSYRSGVRVCNTLRCDRLEFPPIPVMIDRTGVLVR